MTKHELAPVRNQILWYALRVGGSQSLSQLSIITDISRSTIRRILHDWIRLGLLNAFSETSPNRKGRPLIVYSLIDRNVISPPLSS
jgi:predicted transcriptional regulator